MKGRAFFSPGWLRLCTYNNVSESLGSTLNLFCFFSNHLNSYVSNSNKSHH